MELEDVAGKRTRALQKRLKDVSAISDEQLKALLPEINQWRDE